MNLKEILNQLINRQDLKESEVCAVFHSIMSGEVTNAQIAGLIVALRMKGETPEEITGAARAMRQKAISISVPLEKNEPLVDVVGTGGDSAKSFNISTASAFVVAAAGIKVAKHGNRSVSSKSGSADVLEALDVNLNLSPEQVSLAIKTINIGFLFAQKLHPAMKYAAPVRKELGIRSIFNLLGPLSNPAEANTLLLGVYEKQKVLPFAKALKDLGAKKAWVVFGAGGMDELSQLGDNYVASYNGEKIEELIVNPRDIGMPACSEGDIKGGEPLYNAQIIKEIFSGKKGHKMDIVALNSGAAIFLSGKTASLKDGVEKAYNLMLSGKAMKKLDELVRFSKEYV
jgi:anthranilate phosphoribosyltransferase